MKLLALKKILKVFVCFVIALPIVFFSACQGNADGDGDSDDDVGIPFKTWEYVDGFRAAIRPTSPGESAFTLAEGDFYLFDQFGKSLIRYIIGLFGSGTEQIINYDGKVVNTILSPTNSILSNDTQRSFLNYDVIRHVSYISESIYNNNPVTDYNIMKNTLPNQSSWNWAMHYGKDQTPRSYTSEINSYDEEKFYLPFNNISEITKSVIDCYDLQKTNYNNIYTEIYLIPLLINVFEVLLNIEPTVFAPVYYSNANYTIEVPAHEGSETWLKMQVAGEYETAAINPTEYHKNTNPTNEITTRLNWLKNQYAGATSYVGIQWQEEEGFNGSGTAQSDGGRIVKFILNKVIGNDRISEDNFNITNELPNTNIGKRYYQDTITHIVKELTQSIEVTADNRDAVNANAPGDVTYNIGDTAGSFFPVAGIKYSDYRLNDFIVPEIGDNDFVNSPTKEYQSLAIIPKKEMIFQHSILLFQSLTHDVTINLRMRWYNKATGQVVLQDAGQVYVRQGAYHWEDNDNSALVEPPYDVALDIFNSNLERKLAINGIEGDLNRRTTSKYYKTINSSNGFGTVAVTNEEACDFSFFEFVFDVVKNPNDPVGTRYDFQVVMFTFAIDSVS